MPSHDYVPPRGFKRTIPSRPFQRVARVVMWIDERFGRRRRSRRKGREDGGVPVEPNRPNTLSGGAAAELDFGDD